MRRARTSKSSGTRPASSRIRFSTPRSPPWCSAMATSISYDQLVQRITGDTLDKSQPLHRLDAPAAVARAAHLRGLRRDASARRLSGAVRRPRARAAASTGCGEEMEILTSPDTYRTEPEHAWQRLKTRVRKPKELAVLMEVAAWREREAQARDVPRGRVLKDDVIGDIAVQAPTTLERLAALRSLPKGFERSKWGAGHCSKR